MLIKSKRCFEEKCFLSIYFMMCFGICFYQIYKICEIYFKYKTTTFVEYENISMISLPAVTVCINKEEVLKNELDSNLSQKEILEILSNKTIKEQFKMIYEFDEVFKYCAVVKTIGLKKQNSRHKEPYIDCDQVIPIRKSIDYSRLCFTQFSQISGESDNLYVIENNFIFKNFLRFMVAFEPKLNISKVFFIIHPRKELVGNFDDQKHLEFNFNYMTKDYSLDYILYRRIISHSMPPPYETQCFRYEMHNNTSLLNCIDQCRIEMLRNHVLKNEWPGNYLAYDTRSDQIIVDMFKMLEGNSTIDVEIGNKCKKECGLRTECYSEIYKISHKRHARRFNKVVVPIFPPEMPDLVYTHTPSLHYVEFITYIGSAISLHFGISTIVLSNLFIKFAKLLLNKSKVNFNFYSLNLNIKSKSPPKGKTTRRSHSIVPINKKDYAIYPVYYY